jgi:hypothetical protein
MTTIETADGDARATTPARMTCEMCDRVFMPTGHSVLYVVRTAKQTGWWPFSGNSAHALGVWGAAVTRRGIGNHDGNYPVGKPTQYSR